MLQLADLRPYQLRAIDFIKANPSCALWVDMGLGKTVTCLTAINGLFDDFVARRVLVVAPLRVARNVWKNEVNAWAHLNGLRVEHIGGTPAERIAALKRPADIWTLGKENVQWLESLFIKAAKQIRPWPFDMVILDEAQAFKSQSSKRWKSMRRLRMLTARMVQLTGTPAPNGYADLWAQIYLLDQGQRLGRTERVYKERFFNPPPYGHFGKWTLKPFADQMIQKAIADIVLVIKDAEDLPPVVYNPVPVDLGGEMMVRYRRFERAAFMELPKDKSVRAVNAAVLAGKLIQFANGAVYNHDDEGSYSILHNNKIEALLETLENTHGKTLIAYEFRSDKERIKLALEGTGLRWACMEDKGAEAAWMAGELDVLLLHPASAGEGLNLQIDEAETIIWFGLTANLNHFRQLNARLIGGHRRKGKNIVIHIIIAARTRDEFMMTLLTSKGVTQDDLTDAIAKLAEETCLQ